MNTLINIYYYLIDDIGCCYDILYEEINNYFDLQYYVLLLKTDRITKLNDKKSFCLKDNKIRAPTNMFKIKLL